MRCRPLENEYAIFLNVPKLYPFGKTLVVNKLLIPRKFGAKQKVPKEKHEIEFPDIEVVVVVVVVVVGGT